MQYPILIVPKHEMVSTAEVADMARGDYANFVKGSSEVSNSEKWVRDNLLGYYLLINTWLLLCLDIGGWILASSVKTAMLLHGVSETIKRSSYYADIIIRNIHAGNPLTADIDSCPDQFAKEAAKLSRREALQVLRYPKRFTPVTKKELSRLADSSIEKFVKTNDANREVAKTLDAIMQGKYKNYPKYKAILIIARSIVRKIVKDFPGFSDDEFPTFGPGAVRNSAGTQYGKYEFLVLHRLYQPTLPPSLVRYADHPDLDPDRQRFTAKGKRVRGNLYRPHLGGLGQIPQISRVTTVPKKVDAERVIAMEDPYNMWLQLQLKAILERRIRKSGLDKYMPIHNQRINQDMARAAALTGRHATVDWSHASDSVTKTIVQLLFPDDWWKAFLRCIPVGFILHEWDCGPRKLNCFATMGCGCTFVVETIVFFALQLAVLLWFTHKNHPRTLTLQGILARPFDWVDVYAMGDDCICPTWMLEHLISVLSVLGFSVNNDKTFGTTPSGTGNFRESCGTDWAKNGESVELLTSTYWPRIPIKGTWDQWCNKVFTDWNGTESVLTTGLSRIIALQKSLYGLSPNASSFVREVVRSHAPYITSSLPGSRNGDLWDEDVHTIKAYYVGLGKGHTNKEGPDLNRVSVPTRFRKVGPCTLPDGYILATEGNWEAFTHWAVAEQAYPISNLLYENRTYCRDFHIAPGVRRSSPDVDTVYLPILQSMVYDLNLSKREPDGWPVFVRDGVQYDIGKVIHARASQIMIGTLTGDLVPALIAKCD